MLFSRYLKEKDFYLRQKNFVFDLYSKEIIFCLKGRRSIELPEIALLKRFVVVIYLFSAPISLCPCFSIAATNLLNRSRFSISVSDVDSNFSLRLEGCEAEGQNDEWWVVLQVSNL